LHNQSTPEGSGEASTASFTDSFVTLCDNIELAIRGKRSVIELVVLAMCSGGHVLLEDAPGVGKTTLAKSLANSMAVSFGRLQFTPDLLPGDVVGVNIWNRNTAAFEFRPGPVFSNVVLADEINRASPKTQSALLEAMAERQVTVDGATHLLSEPFIVIATQNPYEHEGTYPLPESQLDRFVVKTSIGYPEPATESDILENHGATERADRLDAVLDTASLASMALTISQIHVAPALRDYMVSIATASRSHPALMLGASPRALLTLQRLCQARAASNGRAYITPDDIRALVPVSLPHRLVVAPESATRGIASTAVLDEILRSIPIPQQA
jgi:MoxR-like ATPase